MFTPAKLLPWPWWRRWLTRLKIAWGYAIGRGYWWWDLETGELYGNTAICRVYGLPPGKYPTTYAGVDEMLWADDDRVTVRRSVDKSKELRAVFNDTFCARDQTTGEMILIKAKGWWLYRDNQPVAMLGWNERMPYSRKKENVIRFSQSMERKFVEGDRTECVAMLKACLPNQYGRK